MQTLRTIENILRSDPVDSGQAVVFNTIPLTKRRYERERAPSVLSGFLRRKPKDFIQSQSWRWPNWDAYENKIVVPILHELEKMKLKSRATIDHDVTVKRFKLALHCGRFKAAFLFAHHFRGQIEFADGGVPLSDIKNFIAGLSHGDQAPCAVIFLVCEADEMLELKTGHFEEVGAVGCAAWRVPVVSSYMFVNQWISNLKDGATLSDAYSMAVDHFSSYIRTSEKS
jgi:hypothetical protein